MNKTQAGRTLTLAYHLDTAVEPRHFAMRQFATFRHGRTDSSPISAAQLILVDNDVCGTTACALGHATTLWPERFRLRFDRSFICASLEIFAGPKSGWVRSNITDVKVQRWFGLSELETVEAFSALVARTPQKEAAVLRQLVRKHGWEQA